MPTRAFLVAVLVLGILVVLAPLSVLAAGAALPEPAPNDPDLLALTNGVHQIAPMGDRSPVYAGSSAWSAIASGDEDANPVFSTIVVARGFGSGRVMVAGLEWFLERPDVLDNGLFLSHSVNWLDVSARKRVQYTVGHGERVGLSALGAQLQGQGYSVQPLSGVIDAQKLSLTSVLIIPNAWQAFTASEIAAVQTFVENGGGLFLFGVGWSWGGAFEDYPMMRVAQPYDVRWVRVGIEDPSNNFEGWPIFSKFYPNIKAGTLFEAMATIQAAHDQYGANLPQVLETNAALRYDFLVSHQLLATPTTDFPLDDDNRQAVFEFLAGLIQSEPMYYGRSQVFSRTATPTSAWIRERFWVTWRDALELTDVVRATISAQLQGERRSLFEQFGIVVLDNSSADDRQLDFLIDFFSLMPPQVHNIGSISMIDFLGIPPFNTGAFFRTRVGGVNVFSTPIGAVRGNPFPSDISPSRSDQFVEVVAHEVNHDVDWYYVAANPALAARKMNLLQRAGTEDLNYLRNIQVGDGAFYYNNPQEFLAGIANQWFVDSDKSLQLGLIRFAAGRPEPLNQALFFAEIYSVGANTTRLYRSDTAANIEMAAIPVRRNQLGQIDRLWIGGQMYEFMRDDSGNVQNVQAIVNESGTLQFSPATYNIGENGTSSIFPPSSAPSYLGAREQNQVELGVKFRSDLNGFITGIRFYKIAQDTGVHTGSLWSSTGQLLATGTFTDETASGWQQLNFAAPVAIVANTTYVATYHAGVVVVDYDYFTNQGVDNPPLHALRDGVDGSNGLFQYSDGGVFPGQRTYGAPNYWVDVVFSSPALGALITIARTGGSTGAVGTTVVTSDGTATAGADYTAVSQTVSWTDGDTANKTVTIPIVDDHLAEADETFNVALINPTGGAILGIPNTALVRFLDNETPAGTLEFTQDAYSATENAVSSIFPSGATPAQFIDNAQGVELGVKLRSEVSGFITGVRFNKGLADTSIHTGSLWSSTGQRLAAGTFTNETATGWQQLNFDAPAFIPANTTFVASYHTSSGFYYNLNFFQSQGVDNPPLHALRDGVDGPNGVYQYGPSGVFPNQTYWSSNYWVDAVFSTALPALPATITIKRSGGNTGVVGVTLVTSNGTAAAGSDYTAVSQTLSWANGDTANKTLTIPILDDTLAEGNETVNVALTNPTGGATLGSPSAAVLTIIDNEAVPAGTLQLSVAAYSVAENGGSATITVTRTGGSAGAVGASFATSNGTAAAGSDYTAVSQTVTFASGDTATKTVNIPILDDGVFEGNETINIALSNPTGGATLGSPNTAILTIVDNDTPSAGTLQFSAPVYSLAENASQSIFSPSAVPSTFSTGAVELGVKFRSDANGFITGIRYYKEVTNGSVHTGSLWSSTGQLLTNGTFSFESAAGWQQLNFDTPVAITANTTYIASYHTNGRFYYAGGSFQSQGVDNAPLHALRDGVDGPNGLYVYGSGGVFPNQSYSASNYFVDVVFSTGISAFVTITRTGGSAGAVGVSVATSDGTATAGTDYSPLSRTVNFADGDTAPKTVAVTIKDDSLAEANETVNFTLSNPTGGATLGSPSAAVLTIVDNDTTSAGTLQFSAPAYSLAENGSQSIFSPGAVPSTFSSGAVELGVKFRSDANGFITGIRYYKEGTNGSVHTGSLWSATGQLLANGTFSLESAAGWQQLNFDTPVAITANTTYIASYHTNGRFYYAGGSFQSQGIDNAPLHALQDGVDGPNGLYVYGSGGVFPNQSYSASNYFVDAVFSTSISAFVTITRTGGSAGTVGVTVATSDGTATAGTDYSPLSRIVSFADGDTAPRTIAIGILDDSLPETNETVNLTLSSPTGGAALGSPSTAVLTIIDNDTASAGALQFSSTTYSAAESENRAIFPAGTVPAQSIANASPVELGVKLRSDVSGFITGIRFYKGPGDTSVHSGSLWSSTGQLLANGTFTDETATGWQQLNLAAPVAITANTTYTASYHTSSAFFADLNYFQSHGADNAPLHALKDGGDGSNGVYFYGSGGVFPVLSYSSSNYWVDVVFSTSVGAFITITRTGGSAGAVGVSFATSNGTATAGADYTAVNQIVSFANGDTAAKTVTIPILDDSLVEGNETVNLTLSNPTGGAAVGNPSIAVLTITDND